MTVLLLVVGSLLLAQLSCGVLARRATSHMMRPGDDWDGEDVERWLALIEPFPLRKPARGRRS